MGKRSQDISGQRSGNRGGSRGANRALSEAPREALPAFVPPQLATLARTPPAGGDWLHELKLDGYRIQARVQRGRRNQTELLTRRSLDWTKRMPSIAEAVAELPVQAALLDGEVVVLDDDGTTNFAKLQAAFQEKGRIPLTYFVFDLLHLDGHNLRELPLTERKQILSDLFSAIPGEGPVRLSEPIAGEGRRVFEHACKLGAEGIISKLARSPYDSGRGHSWLKLKCRLEQEFVIGGFTLPSDGGYGVGALLLGYYERGKLIYAGRSGTGFTQAIHRMLREKLEGLRSSVAPFGKLPDGSNSGVNWVKPKLVAQISFSTWTGQRLVRQASFKGLREDKPAKAVRREAAEAA